MSANYLCCQCNTSGGWESVGETSFVATPAGKETAVAASASPCRDDFARRSCLQRRRMTVLTENILPDTRVA